MNRRNTLTSKERSSLSGLYAPVALGKPGKNVALNSSCESHEKTIEARPYGERVRGLLKHRLFSTPLFWSEPLGSYKPFEKAMYQDRFPFDFSIAAPLQLRFSELEWRYRELVRQLKKLPDMDLRWLLIARWLQQEGICSPEIFLPTQILRRLVKSFGKKSPLSPEVLHHWALINCWLPYFEELFRDLREAPKTNRGEKLWLTKLGYNSEAIECALGKRSAVPAAADWVEKRTRIDSRTLQNDYSKSGSNATRKRSARY